VRLNRCCCEHVEQLPCRLLQRRRAAPSLDEASNGHRLDDRVSEGIGVSRRHETIGERIGDLWNSAEARRNE
jgi:hypothetical protein